jgi:hypothetical protein
VHIQFPGTIQGASWEEENKIKPKITLKIEEADVGAPSEVIAKSFLDGVKKGDFHITVDFITDVFRCTTRGSSPFGSILDLGYEFIGTVSYIPACLERYRTLIALFRLHCSFGGDLPIVWLGIIEKSTVNTYVSVD